jgi:AP endonuclease-2
MKDQIHMDGEERHVRDVMNPSGMYCGGVRQREYSTSNDLLPMSGKLIPEFFGRRYIRDMFACRPSLQPSDDSFTASQNADSVQAKPSSEQLATRESLPKIPNLAQAPSTRQPATLIGSPAAAGKKRSVTDAQITKTSKRSKSGSVLAASPATGKGQQSLAGFFKPKAAHSTNSASLSKESETSEAVNRGTCLSSSFQSAVEGSDTAAEAQGEILSVSNSMNSTPSGESIRNPTNGVGSTEDFPSSLHRMDSMNYDSVHDPIETKETWSRLFAKPAAPRCEGHEEPCITLLTKKPGMNLGRSFWMCSRPLGPSGAKEKNTQWRCQTFIWCSDWNPNAANGG